MQTNQTILSLQGCNLPNDPVTTQKKHQGRPLKLISEQELKEILQGISSKDSTQRTKVFTKYGKTKIKHAINIFKTDFGKQGVISRAGCPFHRRQNLSFGWHGYANGVRIKCHVPNCVWTTHYEPMIYGAVNDFVEQSEFENNE
jgi:hypothetical protein